MQGSLFEEICLCLGEQSFGQDIRLLEIKDDTLELFGSFIDALMVLNSSSYPMNFISFFRILEK